MIRNHALAIAAAVVAAAGTAVAGCGSGAPATFTAHGTEQVCAPITGGENAANAYPDISAGAQVTVVSSSHAVIGTGTLATAPLPASDTTIGGTDMAQFFGAYKFTVRVPAGKARYGIEIGQNRGTIWASESQMRRGPGVSLGC
jgi:hypothetical protein